VWSNDQWVDEGPVRTVAELAVDRAGGSGTPSSAKGAREQRQREPKPIAEDVVHELAQAAEARRVPKLKERLEAARGAFERERYGDTKRIIAKLAAEVPTSASVRELHGLTLYKLERWRQAASELEVYRTLTGSVDQNPVLADCYRALRRFTQVADLWEELGSVSPSPEIMAEGRIVMAGALADQGNLQAGIVLLEKATGSAPKKVRDFHLRTWYALGDLYDRAGESPKARQLFRRIESVSPDFADVPARLATLGR
jgi:tetratricopeptide (TPR) repeat protein